MRGWARVGLVSQVTTTNTRLSHVGETDGVVAVAPYLRLEKMLTAVLAGTEPHS